MDQAAAIEKQLASEEAIAIRRLADAPAEIEPKARTLYDSLPSGTANIPLGHTLFDEIIRGRVPIVDLHPDDEAGFQNRHGLSVQTALRLAEARAIVPNLYVTSPQKWKAAGESVLALACHQNAICSSKRTDVLLGPAFETAAAEIAEEYARATHGFDEKDWIALSEACLRRRETDGRDIVKGLANRAARVKLVEPIVWREGVGHIIDRDSRLGALDHVIRHGRRVRSANHIYTGYVTASAGQPYLPGFTELELGADVGFLGSDFQLPPGSHQAEMSALEAQPLWQGGSEFFVATLNLPVPESGSNHDAVLAALLDSVDFVKARLALQEAIAVASKAQFDGQSNGDDPHELEVALRHYEESLAAATKCVKGSGGTIAVLAAATAALKLKYAPENIETLVTLASPFLVGAAALVVRFFHRPHMRRLATSVNDLKKLGLGRVQIKGGDSKL